MGYIKFGPINNLTSPNINIKLNGLILTIIILSIVRYISILKLNKKATPVYGKAVIVSGISVVSIFVIVIMLIVFIFVFALFSGHLFENSNF